jgi:hypothetical protein
MPEQPPQEGEGMMHEPFLEPDATARASIDESELVVNYANFCHVTGTPEELVLDFGLIPHPTGLPTEPVPIGQRIITNYHMAKRLLYALQMTIERHENKFGTVKTSVD